MRKKQWDIFLIAQTDFDHALYVKKLFSDIISAGLNRKVNLHICLNTTNKAMSEIDPTIPVSNITDDAFYATYFFEGILGRNEKRCQLRFKGVNPLFELTNRLDIKRFLDVAKPNKRAKKTLILTWDHGSVVGIFKKNIEGREGNRFLIDYKMLIAKDIKWAFGKAYKKKKIDILLMMNCNMHFFDFGYSLKNSVRYLIAPENNIYFSGYNNYEIFRKLFRTPSISSRRLTSYIIRKQKSIKKLPSQNQNDIILNEMIKLNRKELILNANSLKHYEMFTKLLDKGVVLLSELRANNLLTNEDILNSRDASNIIGGQINLVDFYSFLCRISVYLHDRKSRKLLFKFRKLIDKSVVERFIGTKIRKKLPIGVNSKTIFSIYFPIAPQVFSEAQEYLDFILETSPFASTFSKNHRWDNFIRTLFPEPSDDGLEKSESAKIDKPGINVLRS